MNTNFTNFFNYAAKEPQNTGGGSSQRYALRSKGAQQRVSESETRGVNHAIITQLSHNNHPVTLRAIRYVAVLLMVFMVGIGNAWGDDFEATNISTSGTTKNHVTCKSTAGTITNANICNDNADSYGSGTASMISGSANNNPNQHYIEISAASGYKLVSPVTIHGVAQDNSAYDVCVVYWEGDYTNASFKSWEKVSVPGRKTICDNAKFELTFSGTVRTIRIYKQLYVNNDGFQNSSGTGKTQGGNKNIGVIKITASATSTSGGETPAAPAFTSPAPSPAAAPALQSIFVGETKQFSVSVTGSPTPTYQWYSCADADKTSPSSIGGATSDKYTTSSSLAVGTYYYYCVATNSQGSATSQVFSLQVNPLGSDMTIHTPGTYESTESDGYSCDLVTYDSRRYEVYYLFSANSKLYFTPGKAYNASGAKNLIDGESYSNGVANVASDEWFSIAANGYGNGVSFSSKQQFTLAEPNVTSANIRSNGKIRILVSGYDNFSFVGKDNSNTNQFTVKIDGTEKTYSHSTEAGHIFSFDITTETHYIEITSSASSSDSRFNAFSLRLPCTLTYDANGGSGDAMANTVGSGTVTLRTNTYTKSGCTFQGWATSQANANAGTVAYADGATNYNLSADATLYAVWKLNAPAISCEDNVVTMTVPGGATVYYTTDGSTTPTSGSTPYDPSNKPEIATTTTFKAIAILANHVSSNVATQECIYVAPTPPSTKRIYMKCGSDWCNLDPKFFLRSWGAETHTVEMTQMTGCETDTYYGDIPSGNTGMLFTRQKNTTTEIMWSGDDFWGQSVDITIGDDNLFTCTGWNSENPAKGTFSAGTYAAPTYTISFAGNGNTDGEMSAIGGLACGADQAITANAFVKAGYSFANWTADVDVTVGEATITAGSAISAGATLKNITSDITLTAAWTQEMPSEVNIGGSGWRYFPGQTISLTATPTGGTSDFTYQWQKNVNSVWTNLVNGEDATDGGTFSGVTTNNLQISGCTKSNSGSYRCVVSKLGGSTASDGYDIHIYTLNGNYNGSDWVSNDITLVSGTTGKVELTLEAGRLYTFKVKDNYENYYFGNSGYMLKSESSWACLKDGADIRVFTGAAGTYTFTVDIANTNYGTPEVAVSVTYPSVTHPAAGYVYYDKGTNDWANVAAHWWNWDGATATNFVEWASNPWLTQCVEICGTTYYYMPKLEGYNRVIFHKANDEDKTPDITVDGESSGKYISGKGDAWTAFPSYTITFNSNGGSAVANQVVACGETASAPTAPTRLNYDFVKWQKAGVDYDFATVVSDNITLDAVWSRKTISGDEDDIVIIDGTTINTGGTLSVVRQFANGINNNHVKFAGGIVNTSTNSLRYITFTIPAGNTATVKEALMHSTSVFKILSSDDVTIDSGDSHATAATWDNAYFSLTGNGATQAGATVATTMPAGTYYCGSYSSGLEISKLTLTVATVVPSVKLKVNGEVTQTITISVGEKLGEIFASGSLPTLNLPGYTFNGWKNEVGDAAVNNNTVTTGSMVIYADLTADEYNVTLENGDTDGAATVHYGDAALTITTAVTGEGDDVLTGFYTAATEGTKVADEEGNLVASVTGFTDENGKWIKESDATLYAIWTPYVPSSDATLSDLTVGGTTITSFDAATISYNVELPFGTFEAPTVAGAANDTKAKSVVVTQAASANGDATVVVTAEDNSTKTYTVRFSVVATKNLELVWEKQSTRCGGTTTPNATTKSDDASVSTYINQITFTNVEGSGDDGKEGGSLNVGKKAGNMFTLSSKAGFAIQDLSFYAKIQDASCQYSLNGGEWTSLNSTSTGSDACYEVFADAEVHEFRLRSTGNSGVWIRNMQLTMIQACTAKTIAWTEEPAAEYELGSSPDAIAASANNGTVSYASTDGNVIAVNESTGALTLKALGTVTLSASVAAGDGTTYCATGANVEKASIKTYYLVTFDKQNETTPATVKYYKNDAAIALPEDPTYSGFNFLGWFDAAEGGNAVTSAITPSASRTVYAQWEAQCAGPTITAQPASANYFVGRTASALTCEATPGVEGKALTYTWYSCDDAERTNPVALAEAPTPSTEAAGTQYYYFTVTEAGCDVVKTSDVATITVTDKDPICIIKATPTSATTASVDGACKGNAYFKGRNDDKKLNTGNDYVGVELSAGYTFLATDRVVLNQTANLSSGDITKFYIFTEVPADGKTYVTVNNDSPVKGDNWFTMPAEMAGESALYIGRVDAKCNPSVGYLAVYRTCAPIVNKVMVNGVDGTPDATNHIAFEVPYSTTQSQLEAITYTWASNSDEWTAAHEPVAADEWAFGVENTVTFTDKDGDESVYYVTVTKAVASTDATLASLTVNGQAIALEEDKYVYSYELPFGTTAVPVVAAEANDANRKSLTITQAASASGTATVVVVAEDDETSLTYTINFSVSQIPSYVIYDGSTMDAIAESGTGVSTFAWTMVGGKTDGAKSISVTLNGKTYTTAQNVFGSPTTSDTRYIEITIPEGYMAKFYLAGATNNGGDLRSSYISKEKTGTLDESIAYASTDSYDGMAMTSDFQPAGTYYYCCDNSIRLYELTVTLYSIDYTRETTPGRLGTICLEKGGTMRGAAVFEIAYYEPSNQKIYFDEVIGGEMTPGMPYIFLPDEGNSDKLVVMYGNNAAAAEAGHHNGLYGSFTKEELTPNDGNYIFSDNLYWFVNSDEIYVGKNRAYLKLAKVYNYPTAPAPGRRRVSMDAGAQAPQTPTGFENIEALDDRVQKVLIDGKIYILRGEKMFDTTGRLVK